MFRTKKNPIRIFLCWFGILLFPLSGQCAINTLAVSEAEEVPNSARNFEITFTISLPFTALYSYSLITLIDSASQGYFPAPLRSSGLWMLLGMAVGGSLAIAFGAQTAPAEKTAHRPYNLCLLELENQNASKKDREQNCLQIEGKLELVSFFY
jgi:hypothetical protein